MNSNNPQIPQKILAIRFSSLGDVAMTVPVFRHLALTYPELNITVLTKPFFVPLFEDLPNVTVFAADVKKEYKGFFGLWKLANELQKKDFDAVADLHNVLRTKILRLFFFFMGIKSRKINKGRIEKKKLTRHAPKEIRPLKTTHQRYADVFSELGFSVDLSENLLAFENFSRKNISEKTVELIGNSTKKWIGIAPVAAYPSKTYPPELMEEVIAGLDQSKDYQILIFGGGKKETEMAEKLASKYSSLISVVGKLPFKEELSLISNLDLMLSMDSANGHLGAIFGVPVLTIWGATHPFAGFAPFQQPEENQLLPDRTKFPFLPTSVFGNKTIPGYEKAMYTISPEKVIQRIKQII